MTDEELIELVKPALESRLDDYRVAHSYSVADTARGLARVYGLDQTKCYLAGLVHDWDKCLSEEELFSIAETKRIPIPEDHVTALKVLHAPCGAVTLRKEYPDMDPDVLSAVSKHTVGSVKMSQLDKTIFIADMIEPLRTRSSLDDLRLLVGTSTLDDLFMQCYSRTILYLIEKRRYVYPESIEVWNAIISETSRSSTKPSGKRREVK